MSRATRKEERRLELLAGGVKVLTEHGLEGFTTGRVAQAAGIAQSGFYKYWSDRDAGLEAVAQYIGDQVLAAIRQARLKAASEGQLFGAFAGGLRAMLAHPVPLSLALRFRREPGPFGEAFRDIQRRGQQELYDDMVSLGMVSADDSAGPRLAHYTVVLTMGAVEALLDGEIDDVDAVANDLTRIATLAMGGFS